MKNILAIFIFTCFGIFSQSNSDDKLMDKLCSESCDAINKENFTSTNYDDITTKLGFALLGVYNKNSKEIKKIYGYDVTNPEDVQKMGEKLGAVLVFKCPKFKDVVFKLSQSGEMVGNTINEINSEKLIVSGFVEKSECNEICNFLLKTDNGEKLKIYRIQKFQGSEFLDNFNGAKSLNKVEVEYQTIDIYMGAEKKYQKIKVVTQIKY
ncbi:MAG: hypothetical protein ACK452_08440 [Bacteroidota bacterium]|jgi:hypothetical protein